MKGEVGSVVEWDPESDLLADGVGDVKEGDLNSGVVICGYETGQGVVVSTSCPTLLTSLLPPPSLPEPSVLVDLKPSFVLVSFVTRPSMITKRALLGRHGGRPTSSQTYAQVK